VPGFWSMRPSNLEHCAGRGDGAYVQCAEDRYNIFSNNLHHIFAALAEFLITITKFTNIIFDDRATDALELRDLSSSCLIARARPIVCLHHHRTLFRSAIAFFTCRNAGLAWSVAVAMSVKTFSGMVYPCNMAAAPLRARSAARVRLKMSRAFGKNRWISSRNAA
jgi:hypothetical protein